MSTDSDTQSPGVTETQVLEFQLGSERYCVDIEYVAEIVDQDDLTQIPNSPPHVEGVMDLRGRTTSIVDPAKVFDIHDTNDDQRIVVFDPKAMGDQGAVGWLVDEVDQVSRVSGDEIDDAPIDDDSIRGIIKRERDFVIWVHPTAVTL